MAETVHSTDTPNGSSDVRPGTSRRAGTSRRLLARLLGPLASLRLTVVLFALSMVLVFFGTLAQMNAGTWTVVNQYFRSAYVWIPLQLCVQFGQKFFSLPTSAALPGAFLFPGGWLLGGLLLANLLAAHLVRFRLNWKRSGILLIHSGVVIMMVGELVTGLFAIESRMTLATGESINFVDVSNQIELALIDSSNADADQVAVIPGRYLRQGAVIQNGALPVDLEVLDYQKNSSLVPASPNEPVPPDAITHVQSGHQFVAVGSAEGSGVDTEQREDVPLVVVALSKKGSPEALGTFRFSLWSYPNLSSRQFIGAPQQVKVDGKTYALELRPRRIYKPYTIHLEEFHHELYLGTDKPKDFSSMIRLVDSSRHEDREVRILMNSPLRYAGETFYQSGFLTRDERTESGSIVTRDVGTILQVVRNPGWLLPYVSCAIVLLGMMIHFGLHLVGFLRRRAA